VVQRASQMLCGTRKDELCLRAVVS
jgi:hypothetical protein